MKTNFFKYQAQTSPNPLALEISHAKGSYIFDSKGKKYLDFVAEFLQIVWDIIIQKYHKQ